ncbi:hypothetical protein PMZ80_009177 [Knufia obscura]|uniref:Uncharacterized protein n=2 Tax=Knufia TaxID=430999 RepID=A0AAN8F1Z0_9EURO|nr:hypothetical protein PMZ80_009177 [Knufia obscura]KAK5954868.1 hypothetical protein OHC33_003546 [Knufia fluminis]
MVLRRRTHLQAAGVDTYEFKSPKWLSAWSRNTDDKAHDAGILSGDKLQTEPLRIPYIDDEGESSEDATSAGTSLRSKRHSLFDEMEMRTLTST